MHTTSTNAAFHHRRDTSCSETGVSSGSHVWISKRDWGQRSCGTAPTLPLRISSRVGSLPSMKSSDALATMGSRPIDATVVIFPPLAW